MMALNDGWILRFPSKPNFGIEPHKPTDVFCFESV
jgi:hypothetical protein